MEPSEKTYAEVGRLCSAWSYLEANTENCAWGIIGADRRIGPIITWRLDLRARWALILQHGPNALSDEDMKTLRGINKRVEDVARDRNIIVHGLVTARAQLPEGHPGNFGDHVAAVGEPLTFQRIPTWTVFRGQEAGKCFPISTKAVEIVRQNIQKVGQQVSAFNVAHGFTLSSPLSEMIEQDWPKPLV